jgi:hypothetical protein
MTTGDITRCLAKMDQAMSCVSEIAILWPALEKAKDNGEFTDEQWQKYKALEARLSELDGIVK